MKCFALFDFAETLAELHPSRSVIVADYVQRSCGIKIPYEAIGRAYKAVDFFTPYSSIREATAEQHDDFYDSYNKRLLALLGVAHCVDPKGLIAAFNDKKAHWRLKAGAHDLLRNLKEAGYSIGIISNFDSRLEQVVYDYLNLAEIVDYLHISQVEGTEKPDPRFYKGFFVRHGVSVSQSFYVGDSYSLDFLPAKSLGLDAWLLDELDFYPYLPEAIRSLGEILSRLAE